MLIKTIDQLKELIPTIVSTDFNRYANEMALAEEWLSKELTGQAIIDALDGEGYELLKKKCIDAIAYKGYLEAIPLLDLVETDNGFAVASDSNLVPASTARVNALKEGLNKSLTLRVESLLEYLEASAQFHDDWKASKAYTLIYDTYIFSLTQFRIFAPFAGNRLDFVAAKPQMYLALRLKIEPVISPELSSQIIEELRDEDLSAENRNIIDNLRYAFAYFTIGNETVGTSFLNRVRSYIMKHLDDYPAFKNSDTYAQFLALSSRSDNGPFLACGI